MHEAPVATRLEDGPVLISYTLTLATPALGRPAAEVPCFETRYWPDESLVSNTFLRVKLIAGYFNSLAPVSVQFRRRKGKSASDFQFSASMEAYDRKPCLCVSSLCLYTGIRSASIEAYGCLFQESSVSDAALDHL